jgi:hypothetical protein
VQEIKGTKNITLLYDHRGRWVNDRHNGLVLSAEDFDHATHHRDNLQKELAEMGEFLKKFGEAQIARCNRGIETSVP